MRTVILLGSALTVLMFTATTAMADALPTPRWEINYELSGSTFEIRGTPLGLGDGEFALWGKGTTSGLGTSQPGVSPGTMTLELSDCGGAICVGTGGPARIGQYYLEQHFGVSDVYSDLVSEVVGGGEALGTYDGSLAVNWSTQLTNIHTTGDVYCNMSALFCGLGGLNAGSNPQNGIGSQAIGTLNFNINTANPFDVFSDWVLPADPSGSTKSMHLRGSETGRTLVMPEPGTGVLIGLGLLGLAWRARKA